MPSKVWWPIIARNRFRISASRLPFFLSVSLSTPATDLIAGLQHLLHGHKIDRTELAGPPVFILGHWRSGTTLIHELLELDDRVASPTTYQCFAPWHFLLTQAGMTKFGNFLLPKKRPMDNMRAGWQLPQEDEFALANLGSPSVYQRILFPENPPPFLNSLNSDAMLESELGSLKAKLSWFLKALTYHSQKPLVLKSPPHTGRLRLLRQMYPDAKFIHMVRNPNQLIPSTIRLWQSLDAVQSLQSSTPNDALEQFVFDCFETMYEGLNSQRSELPEGLVMDVRYEDLVADPASVVEDVFGHLHWKHFESIREKLNVRMAVDSDYQPNQHVVDSNLAERIATICGPYSEKYGYA
jgi:hypothetical protein